LLVASALAIAIHAWFAASLLLPLTNLGRAPEYLFLGAPLVLPVVLAPLVMVVLVAIHTRWIARRHPEPWSYEALDYLAPLPLLVAAPLAGVALLPDVAWALPVLLYVLVDLRVWWSCAIAAAALSRFDTRLGSPMKRAVILGWQRVSSSTRRFALDGGLFLGLLAAAIVSTPHLRFTGTLHGDEPKYIRYCESFYQGLGVEVGRQKKFSELTLAYSPPVWRNAVQLAGSIPAETRNLVDDFKTLLRNPGFEFNRGKYTDAWFFLGKDGGFYQVHNPGLSALLFPAYFIDRHFISSSPGYQGVFPAELPATNLMLLVIWAVWGVVVFRLLEASTGRTALSWMLAAAGMLTMPVASFPFQIYPETAGGLIVSAASLWLLFGKPDDGPAWRVAAIGTAVALLPWLHIRMVLLAAALFVCGMTVLSRRRMAFVVPFVVVLGALCLYSYHLTGSLRPDATYATEGGPSPWTLRFAIESAGAIPFDRIWGFFPHAPVYLFAIAGWVPLIRAQPRLGILAALLIAALVVPAAGHGFSAAGATPLRQSVAVIPLATLPIAWALMTWGHRRWVRAAFALLLVISLDSAWSYNRAHIKGTGRMIDTAISGWTPNLLFPWMHASPWAEWRGTFALFILWALTATLVFLRSILSSRPPRGRFAGASLDLLNTERLSTAHVVVAALVFVILGTGATALGGEWTRGDYFLPLANAREAAAAYAARTDRCRTCYSSVRGELGRSDILADPDVQFDFGVEWSDVALGEDTRFVADASRPGGPGWGSVALDFGDGESTRIDVFGRAMIPHAYKTPGARKAVARLTSFGRAPQQRSATVTIRPVSMPISDVEGLPEAVRAAPERGSVGQVLLGPSGQLSDASSTPDAALWAIAWDGQRWLARTGSSIAEIPPGAWVALLRVQDGARSTPLFLRWPHPGVMVGTPVVLNQ
jgi:hypothetical protein